jgi:hypothetical protein
MRVLERTRPRNKIGEVHPESLGKIRKYGIIYLGVVT